MTGLPPALARWEESFAGLGVDVARAVGPLLPALDELVGRLERHGDGPGEPDGYDGTTNRGDFDRLLAEEWLLAEEVPEEFLRRAAEQQLTFLRVASRTNAPRGRVVAILDTGPEQLGVARLVHLAALVVLHRRAVEAGSELCVVPLAPSGAAPVPAGPDGLPAALRTWLGARSSHVPDADDVDAAFATTDHHDQVWLLAGPTARRHAPAAHRRSVGSEVALWDQDGARRLALRVGDSTVQVEVPDPRAAVAVLRGEGLLRRVADPSLTCVPTPGHGAVFHSADARLLWRGETDHEVLGCFVSGDSKVRRYRFQGAVLAANSLGKRVVAAVTDGTTLWIEVIGKHLARTDRIHVPLSELGVDAATVTTQLGGPLAPLHLQATTVLARLGAEWWSLEAERCWRTALTAVVPGPALDTPRTAYRTSAGSLWVGSHEITDGATTPLLGPATSASDGPWVAWSADRRVWRVAHARRVVAQIAVEERDRVIGLGLTGPRPFLLVTSESGRVVRQLWSDQVRTWTRWAGPAHFSLHPHRPWLARTTEGRITVGDLDSGDTLLELKVSS